MVGFGNSATSSFLSTSLNCPYSNTITKYFILLCRRKTVANIKALQRTITGRFTTIKFGTDVCGQWNKVMGVDSGIQICLPSLLECRRCF